MAFGQIDPSRLQGDALRRWYSRTPAEIEEQRKAAVDRAHREFFFPSQNSTPRSGLPGAPINDALITIGGPDGLGRREGEQALVRHQAQGAAFGVGSEGGRWARPRAAAESFASRTRISAESDSCVSCHGAVPPPINLPPPFGTFPLPPVVLPFLPNGSGGSGGGAPGGKNPKQCAMQYENDSYICNGLDGAAARRHCWESAAQREAHCIKSRGEIGIPPLITR